MRIHNKIKLYLKNRYFDLLGLKPSIQIKNLYQDNEWHSWGADLELFSDDPKIISAGLSCNISFEINLLKHTRCTIIALDPTPSTADYIRNETNKYGDRFVFVESALSLRDGKKVFYVHKNDSGIIDYLYSSPDASANLEEHEIETRSIGSIANQQNWDTIDLLKIDVEGEEYEIIPDLLRNNIHVKQIALEYHHRFFSIGIRKTLDLHKLLVKSGYKIALRTPWCEEFLYIKS